MSVRAIERALGRPLVRVLTVAIRTVLAMRANGVREELIACVRVDRA
jgi:uncharacterized protein (DUF433 family)